ncbi:hypothetical protein CIB48_g2426 [Xylaria polymorpha]|nr:hypothetical protein CIB48_g2426 [Xylaria polymorpha]
MRRVVVTGLGAVTPLGVGVRHTWNRLIAGHSGIVSVAGLEPQKRWRELTSTVAGVVPKNANNSDEVGLWRADDWLCASDQRRMSTFSQYAMAAAEMALTDAAWKPEKEADLQETGVCLGSGIGNLEELYKTSLAFDNGGYKKVSPLFVPQILINLAAGHISMKYGFQGPNHAATTACTTGAHSIGDASRFIAYGDADVMVAGGAESCIHPLTFAGFGRSRSLSTAFNADPASSCQHAKARGAHIYAEVKGYGCSGDAHHMTAPRENGSGAFLAMKRALKHAGIKPHQVDYINAHATGTAIGDAAEAAAIRSIMLGEEGYLEESQVAASSTKGSIGHLLGAAGAIEAVFSILAITENTLPPTMNLHDPTIEPKFNLVPLQAQEKKSGKLGPCHAARSTDLYRSPSTYQYTEYIKVHDKDNDESHEFSDWEQPSTHNAEFEEGEEHERLLDPNIPDDDDIELHELGPGRTTSFDSEAAAKANEEDSPYEEVRAAVRNFDEDLPCSTIRAWTIGLSLTFVGAALNTLFSLRAPSIGIGPLIAQIIAWVMGRLWERVVPDKQITLFGVTCDLNPGPFNIKEHSIIVVMASVSFSVAYATDIILAQLVFYKQNFGIIFQLLIVVSTQSLGYGIAGIMRKFLVYPASMIWPDTLVGIALMNAMYETHYIKDSSIIGGSMSRYRWFGLVALVSCVYYFIPGFFAQFLSVTAVATWFAPQNAVVNQIFGGITGLSLIPITFDWTQVAGYIGSPLIVPCLPSLLSIIHQVRALVHGISVLALSLIAVLFYPTNLKCFKTYGFITMSQALRFVSDLKFGHYMKIPPRTMFMAQVVATTISCFIQVIVLNFALNNIDGVCDITQPQRFTCPGGRTFFSASVIWGLIGPARVFSPGQIYSGLLLFFVVGAVTPVIIYFAAKRYPHSPIKYLMAPLIFGGAGSIPPATPLNYLSWGIVGYIFQFVIKKRHFRWWRRLNYLTSAGLDLGLALGTLIIFFAFTLHDINPPQWWGNTVVATTLDYQGKAVQAVLPPGETCSRILASTLNVKAHPGLYHPRYLKGPEGRA